LKQLIGVLKIGLVILLKSTDGQGFILVYSVLLLLLILFPRGLFIELSILFDDSNFLLLEGVFEEPNIFEPKLFIYIIGYNNYKL
jgi:hypothetical protein